MSDAPRVTVLMPVYNAGDYLDEAVASVLAQSLTAFELLIVDDGSDASCACRLDAWARRDARIRVLRHPDNRGITRALNTGLAAARGHYLARQDADDISLPRRLETQVRFLDGHPDHVLVGCDCALIDRHGRTTAIDSTGWTDCELQLIALVRTPIVHSSAMFRLDPVRRHGLAYDERYAAAEDFDLWVRMLAFGRLAAIPELLVLYRLHDAAISSRHRVEQHRNMHEIALRHCLQRLPGLAGRRPAVEAFLDLLYLGAMPTAQRVALAGEGSVALADAAAAEWRLTPRQRFRARRLCARWLAMGLLRSRAWSQPWSLAPLLRRAPSLAVPLAAEALDYAGRRLRGRLRRPLR